MLSSIHNNLYVLLGCASILVLGLQFFTTPYSAYAENWQAATITVTLDSTNASGSNSSNISPSSTSSATAIIWRNATATVTNATSYTISTSTSSTDLKLNGTDNNNKLVALTSNAVLSSNDFGEGKWGLYYNMTDSPAAPTTPTVSSSFGSPNQTIANNISLSGSSYAANKKLKLGIGAKAASTQAAGKYSGATLTLSVTATNRNAQQVTYDVNAPSGVSITTPDSSAKVFAGDKINLAAAPTATGYVFQGWCKGSAPALNTGTCSERYDASAEYTTPTTNGTTTMSAYWKRQYSITYHKNTTDTVTGMPSPATITKTYGETVPITASPTRSGYNFKGWCKNDSNSNTCTALTGTPTAQSVENGSTGTAILYAKWELAEFTISFNANNGTGAPSSVVIPMTGGALPTTKPARTNYGFVGWSETQVSGNPTDSTTYYRPGETYMTTGNKTLYAVWDSRKISNITYMQDMNPGICDNTTASSNMSLTDKRDNKKYLVNKLADGNCWMTQNLALPGDTTIKPSDSNVSANFTLPASIADGSTGVFNGSHKDATVDTYGYTNGKVDSSTSSVSNGTNSGGYYSFHVATANTLTSGSNSGSATSDICPKNWHLPQDAEFANLVTKELKINGNTNWLSRYTGTISGWGLMYSQNDGVTNNAVATWWSPYFYSGMGGRAHFLERRNGTFASITSESSLYYAASGVLNSVRCVL